MTQSIACIHRWSLGISLALAGGMTGGCAHSSGREKVAWTPKPRVQWAQLSTQPLEYPVDGFHLLVQPPTKGLFPASIAVSRLGVVEGAPDWAVVFSPNLVRDPRNEFLQWNTAFDDQMAVSEVFPIAERDLGGGVGTPHQLLAAMRALGAQIGLIYAVNQLSENETEMLGTLYQTAGFQPLATIHAFAKSVDPPEDSGPRSPFRRDEPPENAFETESKALVRKRFEGFVYACVRELIVNDEPSAVESPEGWVPDGGLHPAEWPPRYGTYDPNQ